MLETVPYQEVLTPVPVRVSLPAQLGTDQVVMYYRTFGNRDWDALELRRSGQTWVGAVSCFEVSTVTGSLQFFLRGQDTAGHTVASTGSPAWPHVVPIVHRAYQGPAALAGDPLPWRCADPADCPSDFPGCPQRPRQRPPCESDDNCEADSYCAWDGYCDAIHAVLHAPARLASGN